MALTIQNWARATVSANEPITTLTDASISGCFREYNYYTADTQATVAASGYFNASVTGAGVAYDLVTGDYINVYSTADAVLNKYRVTNTSGVITTAYVSTRIQTSVTMTAAQVNGMYAAPFVILAAPGANRMYVIDQVGFSLVYGSAQFAAGGAISLQYGSTVHAGGTLATATLAGATFAGLTASSTFTLVPVTIAPVAVASMANVGMYLSNDTAAFTTGTGCSLIVNVSARVMATA